jgi:hypothetical protein
MHKTKSWLIVSEWHASAIYSKLPQRKRNQTNESLEPEAKEATFDLSIIFILHRGSLEKKSSKHLQIWRKISKTVNFKKYLLTRKQKQKRSSNNERGNRLEKKINT